MKRKYKVSQISKIEKTLEEERQEVAEIEHDIRMLHEKLLEKHPSHFSKRDVINALFASSVIAFTIILKGNAMNVAMALDPAHILAIIIGTCVILCTEIYYVGYSRVKPQENRKLGQFMIKRFLTFYGVAIIVSFFLIYILAVNKFLPTSMDVLKMVILMSMPSAIGGAIPSMLKQF